jgi:AraC-like DNA-binding protein
MKPQTNIPVVRADMLAHYCRHFQDMGAPVEGLLELSGIPPEILAVPNAVVPLRNAFRCAEYACSSLQTEHLGLYVGEASTLEDLGAYGHSLGRANTIGDYLQRGIDLFSTLTIGERLWTSSHGEELRLNCASTCDQGLGAYQSQLFILVLSVATVRKVTGPNWWPGEVGLAYKSREPFPSVDTFAHSRIIQGVEYSYISLPTALLEMPLPQNTGSSACIKEQPNAPLPTDFIGLVMAQVDAFSADNRDLHIDSIAESLDMSRRTLQRAIDREGGLSYKELLTHYRMERAAQWLVTAEKSVTEIALKLGYTDTSNFSRAFRRHTGLSPSAFRAGIASH